MTSAAMPVARASSLRDRKVRPGSRRSNSAYRPRRRTPGDGAADQEDFVSMGMNTAIKNFQILDNAYGVLGIEFMAAAQALDFRDYKFGKGVTKAKEVIRKYVKFLDEDRPLYSDHTKMKELVKSCEILHSVEKAIGSLE